MAFQDLVNGYIQEAWDLHPGSTEEDQAARLDALAEERKRLWEEVKGGDWESMSTSFSASSSSWRRGIDSAARHRSCVKAFQILAADATATKMRGGVILPVFKETPIA